MWLFLLEIHCKRKIQSGSQRPQLWVDRLRVAPTILPPRISTPLDVGGTLTHFYLTEYSKSDGMMLLQSGDIDYNLHLISKLFSTDAPCWALMILH